MNELIERISLNIPKKKVTSKCKKILKKCSFKSSKDLQNISSLATWLYVYGYYDEMIEVCDLLKDMTFANDYDIWFNPDLTMCLKSRVFRERGLFEESKALVELINEHRHPELYVNLIDHYYGLDINIEEELRNRPRSVADGWRFCKLDTAIRYREGGQFPIDDEKLDSDIEELVSILKQLK